MQARLGTALVALLGVAFAGCLGTDAPLPPEPEPEPDSPLTMQVAVEPGNLTVTATALFNLSVQVIHSWDWGDDARSNGETAKHTYAAAGSYLVELTTTSANGTRWTANQTIEVTGDPDDQGGDDPILKPSAGPRVVVGMSDTGINPYHEVYYRPGFTKHPCTYVIGYDDCNVEALPLSVGPDLGTYEERVALDQEVLDGVEVMTWYWIPQTNIIAIHCPDPYPGSPTDPTIYDNPRCILDDTTTHGTQTTSSMLSEAPEALLVFNEGNADVHLDHAPVNIDIQSHSWGSVPVYAGATHAAGVNLCSDDAATSTTIKFRSAGNNGPLPNTGDCWRNGYRSYSVAGGYPNGEPSESSGSTPDFASYWCRPAADPRHVDNIIPSVCGTSLSTPTAAGAAATGLLDLRRELGYAGASTDTEVAPGISHEDFVTALAWGATYTPPSMDGFPAGSETPGFQEAPYTFWGWGWLDRNQAEQVTLCALGDTCPDNKSQEAWDFNEARRDFAADTPPS